MSTWFRELVWGGCRCDVCESFKEGLRQGGVMPEVSRTLAGRFLSMKLSG
jgi:hypothetical protein